MCVFQFLVLPEYLCQLVLQTPLSRRRFADTASQTPRESLRAAAVAGCADGVATAARWLGHLQSLNPSHSGCADGVARCSAARSPPRAADGAPAPSRGPPPVRQRVIVAGPAASAARLNSRRWRAWLRGRGPAAVLPWIPGRKHARRGVVEAEAPRRCRRLQAAATFRPVLAWLRSKHTRYFG